MNTPKIAIIAVAGYGTRRLPVAKSVEKCMLPLLNRPIVDYVVEDCVRAGVEDIYFVVSDRSDQLQRYYERDPQLETYLQIKGKTELIKAITPPENVRFHYIVQPPDAQYGTAVPLWLAREVIDQPFYLVMGDQCLRRPDGQSEMAMLAERISEAEMGSGMIGAQVEWSEVHNYGVIRYDDRGGYQEIVEKPKTREEAPSNLINASVYALQPDIMPYVTAFMERESMGEYYLTDVVNRYVADGHDMYVHTTDASYLDCGTVENWVRANQFLLEHQNT